MNRNQTIVLGITLALILGLYFVPTKPSGNSKVDRSRAIEMETASKAGLLKRAEEQYSTEQLAEILRLKDLIAASDSDSSRLSWLEKLSAEWYKIGEPALAGIYAEEIADKRNNEDSWAIAGTTYALGMKKYSESDIRTFCRGRAVKALENAISINPENVQHRINLSLCYVDMPLEDEPMKGILMLRELLDKNPKDVAVLTQLAMLAIRTGQYDKAIGRLETAFAIEPGNKQVISLLATAYQGMGDTPNAQKYESLLNK